MAKEDFISHRGFHKRVGLYMIIVELAVYFIALIPIVLCVQIMLLDINVIYKILSLMAGFFGFQFALIFSSAIFARMFSNPAPGRYAENNPVLAHVYLKEALSTLASRSFIRDLANFFPFPGWLYYRLLGAKISHSAHLSIGTFVFTPSLVSIGDNTAVGSGSIISGHIVSDNKYFAIGRVEIGNNVVIGARCVIFPFTKIGDNSVIATGSVINPGTVIPSNEIWGGVPAKKIKDIETSS